MTLVEYLAEKNYKTMLQKMLTKNHMEWKQLPTVVAPVALLTLNPKVTGFSEDFDELRET